MNKWLVFSLHGTQYAVPASVVAKNYAEYYDDTDMERHKELYDEVLMDDDELIDWAKVNMNPEDFEGSEILIRSSTPWFSEVFFGEGVDVDVVISDPRCATK
jgi:hypothetical protein